MFLVGVVLGKVSGYGLSLCAVCDRVIALQTVQFDFAQHEGEYLVAKVGKDKLGDVGGKIVDAAEAKALCIVWTLVKSGQDVDGELATICEKATMCAPNAVSEAKGFLQKMGGWRRLAVFGLLYRASLPPP